MNDPPNDILLVLGFIGFLMFMLALWDKASKEQQRREEQRRHEEDIAALEDQFRRNGYRGPHSEFWSDRFDRG